jgi:hypothetical protein
MHSSNHLFQTQNKGQSHPQHDRFGDNERYQNGHNVNAIIIMTVTKTTLGIKMALRFLSSSSSASVVMVQ